MADLLLELLSEEIPARMQSVAAEEFGRLIEIAFDEAKLVHAGIATYVTPRRLTLTVEGLPLAQPDVTEQRRGPRVGSPEAAVQGFLKAAGISSLEECEERDTGKGVFYFATIRRTGRPTAEVLPELLRAAILELPWPKSMRFPAARFRWVRPLVSVLSVFDGRLLPLDLDEIPVGFVTRGHRFLSAASFGVRNFADYRQELRNFHVMLDSAERKSTIAAALAAEAAKAGLMVKEDAALLDEVTGLVEWPVVLMGRIEPEFMALPPEVLTASMRAHQKYFACLDASGKLAPQFLLVANTIADDGGAAIVAGNERVLRARLSDAKFFWDQDRKVTLESRVPKLAERVFYAGLGTMAQKVARIRRLAGEIAESLGNPFLPESGANLRDLADRAAELAKADLTTSMVGEFPELQGIVGGYYAQNDNERLSVAQAIREHYAPLGPSDRCPNAEVSICVALADKIDTLVGFFAINEKPTGSKDPFALRRAALGVIRLISENGLRIPLREILRAASEPLLMPPSAESRPYGEAAGSKHLDATSDLASELLDFFADRLKIALRDQGVRHDLVAAVFALGDEDDLVRLVARVKALGAFLDTDDGANLLVAYKRATNIVRIEEGKDKSRYDQRPDAALFKESAEKVLAQRLTEAAEKSAAALSQEHFAMAMAALASLRAPVDEFFEKVTVNVDDRVLRANRLKLLSQIRDTLNRVADFSQIEG